MSCPNCYRKKRNKLTIENFLPKLNFYRCFNCKKKFIWFTLLNKSYFVQKASLLK